MPLHLVGLHRHHSVSRPDLENWVTRGVGVAATGTVVKCPNTSFAHSTVLIYNEFGIVGGLVIFSLEIFAELIRKMENDRVVCDFILP